MSNSDDAVEQNDTDIAIVGMAAHLPGAPSIEAFWDNLSSGISSISELDKEDLIAGGESPARLHHKNYVPFSASLDGFDMFDAEFFGFSPKEAAIMDPQHRQFLEVSWEALENAGHPPEKFDGPIGAFGGCGMGSYFYFNICSNPDLVDDVGMFLLRHTGNDKDFLTTRLSHVLDLRGPSVNVQTACSTSLVAAHYACQALLGGECDMALAGGVTIELPQNRGYVYEDGEILSPDGQCHAFDHRAQGTVFGSGAGVVVLRRLSDAIRDGDHIWGVIKGTAINNDGAAKAGYLAPSVDGQAAAISEAQALAGVDAGSIDYIESHGTGTFLGDPIEVAALSAAFQETTDKTGFCRIGSVKTNIGHLDTAAGVAGLIKTSLALYHRQIPPSLGFEKANPAIDFENSPFQVNTRLTDWTTDNGPRRAGVNALGVGGTNAHAVLEQAPDRAPSEASDWPYHLLTVSGRNRAALDANAAALAAHLRARPDQALADVAFTLKEGRRAFEKRRVLVAQSHEQAAALLEGKDARRIFDHTPAGVDPDVVFMFPGGGAQFVAMARDLYETEPVFQDWMDRGLDILQPQLDYDIRAIWLPTAGDVDKAEERLKRPSVQLPLIMIVEYALAKLWMSWGVQPAALIGHSMGENTAACVAGVMRFEDCIGLVLLRGRLFDTMPAGGMLSVPMSVDELTPLIGDELDIAGLNAPELTVVSGPQSALDRLENQLAKRDVECHRIAIDIAAHSRMLDAILDRFRDYLKGIQLSPPNIPFVSNTSGTWITDSQATDPDYWVGHLRGVVRFSDGITTLAQQNTDRVYIEVGPGKALAALVRMHGAVAGQQVLSSLRHPDEAVADDVFFLESLGRLAALGVGFDWSQIWGEARRNRVPLPTYAFQRSRYFIEPGNSANVVQEPFLEKLTDPADWSYRPVWKPQYARCDLDVSTDLTLAERHTWLILVDDDGLGAKVAAKLRGAGHKVVELGTGDRFSVEGDDRFVIAPERGREGYDQLLQNLVAQGIVPDRIVSFWLAAQHEKFRPGSSLFHQNLEQGFYSLLFLAQTISDENLPMPLHITAVTNGAVQVRNEGLPYPEKSTILGPIRVIPKEFPAVTASLLDVRIPEAAPKRIFRKGDETEQAMYARLVDQVLEELIAEPGNLVAALRGEKRFEAGVAANTRPADEADQTPAYRENGVYFITGGLGGIGLTLAEEMINQANAKVALLSRTDMPDRADWPKYLRAHGPGDRISASIQSVKRLEKMGGEIMIVTGDVCNLTQMRQIVATVQDKFGTINGVVHAAGVIDDGPLLAKSPASVEGVFTPKIHGTQVLHDIFPDGLLDWMVLFSSTSTVIAAAGQVDYVAANEYLNAYAQSRSGDKTQVLALNWGIWNTVGMAARVANSRNGDAPSVEPEKTAQPLLDLKTFDAAGNRVFSSEFSGTDQWVLNDHRTSAGAAILPGTAYLELAAEALKSQGEADGYEIRDLLFLRPFQVDGNAPGKMRLKLTRSDEGYDFTVSSGLVKDGRDGFVLNAQARLGLGGCPTTSKIDIAVIKDRCGPADSAQTPDGLRSPQEAHLTFGPRWRVLRERAYGQNEGLARLALPLGLRGDLGDGYILHPALLDLATGWAMGLIEGYQPTSLWVPMSYRQVRVHKALPIEIFSWARRCKSNNIDSNIADFDVTICDSDGNVCVEVEGFSIKRLDRADGLSQVPRPRSGEIEFLDDQTKTAPLTAAEERFQYTLSQGIEPGEGARAFAKALATGLPQVFVSSLDLPGLVQQSDAQKPIGEGTAQRFQRPELDSDYIAPENDFERTLAGFWQDLLGVEKVGIADNFFDLGGHSLIAVRLFAMVKKAYRVEFPISVLFEAPTIARCAAMIAAKVGPPVNGKSAELSAEQSPPTRRFTHAVAMHEGEAGAKTPFFLVAGMFGNVLNLRHLAHLIGVDRPFFGLQARGLYGDQKPHNSLTEAAADYIAEIRVIQPKGPYLLGGFSGGGITAFEIARQLEQAGEQVALLAMLDTPLPVRPPLTLSDRMVMKWQDLKRKGPKYGLEWITNRIRWEVAKRRPEKAETGQTPDHSFHNDEIEAAFLTSVANYSMQPWTGHLEMFRPPQIGYWHVTNGRLVDSQRAYLMHDNGWGRFVPEISVHEIPGDHDSMVLEPNVRVLAAKLREAIQRVEDASDLQMTKSKNWPFDQAAE